MVQLKTKICRFCKIDKFIGNFNKSKSVKNGHANKCKNCRSIHRKSLNYIRITNGTKLCNICDSTKDISNFSSDSKNSDGLRSTCKKCSNISVSITGSTLIGFLTNLFRNVITNAI